ncbi:WD40 repeat-like protein [Neolentinus lepideus HHB14362 ss-1]|uniref:WD40 repeat-like protein n=1 Tax=Neolentinus lepideus HHB14362 ss-1 TaxID=1314782 RepID=A0A165SKQ2_9AGAM|nr:WD40 repeat-like protein [Neolentinus lepideus HHB14362 ss-1]
MSSDSDSPFLLVMNIAVEDLPPADPSQKRPKVFVRLRSGKDVQKTKVVELETSSHTWATPLVLSDIDAKSSVSLTVYYRRWMQEEVVGSVERPFLYFREHNGRDLTFRLEGTKQNINSSIRLWCCTDHETVNGALVQSISPGDDVVNPRLTAVSDAITTLEAGGKDAADRWASLSPLVESIEPFKNVFDEVAKIHPFAAAAWGLLSMAWSVLQAERTRTKQVLDLREAMIKAYMVAQEDEVLKKLEEFRAIFADLMKQTSECALFLSQYFSGGFFRRLTNIAADKKIQEFTDAFQSFHDAFHDKSVRKITIVSLASYECIKFVERQTILQRLQPHPQDGSADSRCLSGTRKEYIEEVLQWFSQEDNKVLWLTGPLGSGKTTLAFTIAEYISNIGPRGRLGAFILFRRDGVLGMRDPRQFVTTLAYKLAEFDDRIGDAIAIAVRSIPDLQILSPHQQFQRLVIEPLMSIDGLKDSGPIMILVDALDESAHGQPRELLLKDIISKGFGPSLSFIRFIITSRPTPDISELLSPLKNRFIQPLWLDVSAKEASRDISLYFREKLEEMQVPVAMDGRCRDDIVRDLTDRAGGLFIWASLTYEFIKVHPEERIKTVLADASHSSPDTDQRLCRMYETTLEYLVGGVSNKSIKNEVRNFIGAVVVAQTPPGLTPRVLGRLFANSRLAGDTFLRLKTLIASEESEAIRFLHKSFYEFVEYEEWSKLTGWYINVGEWNKTMMSTCLARMREYMSTYMADPLTYELGSCHEDPHIPYVCQYWMCHLVQVEKPDEDITQQVHAFFTELYLRWIHLIVLLRESHREYDAISSMGSVVDWVMRCGLPSEIFQHALAFLQCVWEHQGVQRNPVLLYTDGLMSVPLTNSIRRMYSTGAQPVLDESATITSQLCCHTEVVFCVAFSPDGRYVASTSADWTIQVWDSTTGLLRYFPLKDEGGAPWSVNFSPSGDRIVSGHANGHVWVWDAETGSEMLDIAAHSNYVRTVAFSPDGEHIASGCYDCSLAIWNARSGEALVGPLSGHADWVRSVAFSPDGALLASAYDEAIKIWDVKTGKVVLGPLEGYQGGVYSVSFSPDGTMVAAGSFDRTVCLWSAATGEAIGTPLRGHEHTVYSVAFSPEGSRIVSGSWDQTVRVWDVATGSTILGPLKSHGSVVNSVAWSPDGRRIVSGSDDHTVRIWDALTGGVLFASRKE